MHAFARVNAPEWLTGAGGGGLLAGLLSYFGGRHHGRAEFINAVSAAADRVIKRLEEECARVTGRCSELERQLSDEREKCDAKLAHLQGQVDELMQGKAAPYRLGPTQ